MKVATWNIDWGRKYRSAKHYLKIEALLNEQDFDLLILTEAINLNLSHYPHKYFSVALPQNQTFAGVNYTQYLKGELAYRVAIYSKYPAIKILPVADPFTSLSLELEIGMGKPCLVYGTIIGTRFRKLPYAKLEKENFLKDCDALLSSMRNVIIAGDLNTSFSHQEKSDSINTDTTATLKEKFKAMDLYIATEAIPNNIDHIILSDAYQKILLAAQVFVEKNLLSDHKGVWVEFDT